MAGLGRSLPVLMPSTVTELPAFSPAPTCDNGPMSADSPRPTDASPDAGSYLHPATESEVLAEIEVKRSRFIGLAKRTASEEEAREFIAEIRQRYPDARHHCSAYIVRIDGAQPVERSNDDGEPAGTAGMPMLEVLRGGASANYSASEDVPPTLDVTVVVVRYFGGVLLGTGGLVRAYQDVTRAVLDQVRWTLRVSRPVYRFDVGFADVGRVEASVRQAGVADVSVDYGARAASFTVATDVDMAAVLAEVTRGEIEPKRDGMRWVDMLWPSSTKTSATSSGQQHSEDGRATS